MISQLYIATIFSLWFYLRKTQSIYHGNLWTYVTRWLFITQGIYLPFLRMIEPLFFATFKKNVRNVCCCVFCCRRQKKRKDIIDEQSMIDRNLFTDAELEEEAARYQAMRRLDREDNELLDSKLSINEAEAVPLVKMANQESSENERSQPQPESEAD